MKDSKINIPFAILTCALSVVFSVGIFYASVQNRLTNLELYQKSNSDVRERVVRIETKVDLLLKDKQ